MLIRLPLAFVLGLVMYMCAMVVTVYDGVLSMIFQPIAGSIFTAVALLAIAIVGSPLLLSGVWRRWQKAGWLPLALSAMGLCALVASALPGIRVQVTDPETHQRVNSLHPVLSIGGWAAAMFGVAYCPRLGCRGDRRWA